MSDWMFGENSALGGIGAEWSGKNAKDRYAANQEAAEKYKTDMLAVLPEVKILEIQKAIAQGYDPDLVLKNAFDEMAAEDPQFRNAQIDSLQRMGEWSKGQMTSTDVQNADVMRRANAMENRAQQEAINQQFSQRGAGPSSTAQYASAQNAAAAGANRNAQQGQQQLGDLQGRAYQALGQYSSMAGQARGFEDMQKARKAAAANNIAMLNSEATNRARQFGAEATNRVNLFDADAANAMNRYNQDQNFRQAGLKQNAVSGGYGAQQDANRQYSQDIAANDARWGKALDFIGSMTQKAASG